MIFIFILVTFLYLLCTTKKNQQRLATFTNHAYLSAEIHLIYFSAQMQKKRQSACNPIISVFLLHVRIRVIGKSLLKREKKTIFLIPRRVMI